MSLPTDISSDGWRIDRLIGMTSAFALLLFAVFIVWLAVALWRGTRRQESAPLSSPRRQALVPLAFAAFVLFVVDAALMVTSTRDLHAAFLNVDEALEAGAVRIEVSAQKWAWNVRYAGPDGLFATADDPVTVGELVVPAARAVVIELASSDVVHSLHIPNLRIKRDAIPGRLTRLWFEATRVGEYDVLCAQFCGTGHALMQARLRVLSAADFDAWLESAAADSLAIAAEDERSLADDPDRRPLTGAWPGFISPPFGRQWGWPWR